MTDKEKFVHDWTVTPPRVAVLHVERPDQETVLRTPEDKKREAVNLFEAIGVEICWDGIVTLSKINSHTLLGKGKVQELGEVFQAEEIEAVLVNTVLGPGQQRSLEREWKTKVLDRTGVILEIFAQRARTKAARLQVALAQIQYQQSRLVRSWTHLERQRGSLGKVGGPGERQIELDRRMLLDKATDLRKKLQQVQKEQAVQRGARQRNTLPQIALVGYTNAGKSTLFERLTGHEAGSENKLFATLDPLVRKLTLPSGRNVVLSDTVGFVADLPHELVAAFEATLEEVRQADLILHVHDASHPEAEGQAQDVVAVLKEIGAEDVAVIEVANKLDQCLNKAELPINGVGCSALNGEGIDRLLAQVEAYFSAQECVQTITLNAAEGKRLAWLFEHAQVKSQVLEDESWHLTVQFTQKDWQKWQSFSEED